MIRTSSFGVSLRSKLLAVVLACSLSSAPCYATWPTIDIANIFQNTITAVESKVQSYQAVQQTVALLEQVAQLYAIYDNALSLYKSVGNAVDSVKNFKNKWTKIKESWTSSISWKNLGSKMSRWEIKPSNDGALGEINAQLHDYNHDVRAFNNSLRAAPRAMTRDRFIRNVVRGVDSSKNADGSYKPLDLSSQQEASAMMEVADYSSGQLSMQLAVQDDVRSRERASLAKVEEQLNSDDAELDQTQALLLNNQLMVRQNAILLDAADQQAAIALEQNAANTAIRAQLNAINQREESEAAVRAALGTGRDY